MTWIFEDKGYEGLRMADAGDRANEMYGEPHQYIKTNRIRLAP